MQFSIFTLISFIVSSNSKGFLRQDELAIPDKYIVRLKTPESETGSGFAAYSRLNVLEAHTKWLLEEIARPGSKSNLGHTYDFDKFLGYSGTFEAGLLDKIREDPAVECIEKDQMVWTLDRDPDYNEVYSFGNEGYVKSRFEQALEKVSQFMERLRSRSIVRVASESNIKEQNGAPWGLSRVSSGRNAVSNTSYKYPTSAGSGVDAYVIDTGINIEHEDFEGRAVWGSTIPEYDMDVDGNGHGTHCAGIIGGKTYGVAKNATLIAVKVLRTNGYGTNADVLKGVEWVVNNHRVNSRRGRRSVVNMSLGGGKSLALEAAVNAAIDLGIHFSVAAGNDNTDACSVSPAGAAKPITVGASASDDTMAYFSNIGPCVDIFAPGLDILSTWIGSNKATNTISGTSMASPHVAGVLALYLGEQDYTPKELKSILLESAIDVLEGLPLKTANKLVTTASLLESQRKNSTIQDLISKKRG